MMSGKLCDSKEITILSGGGCFAARGVYAARHGLSILDAHLVEAIIRRTFK